MAAAGAGQTTLMELAHLAKGDADGKGGGRDTRLLG